ncbi:coiled-coil domain-containing protein 63 [Discoglossus pictus]
MPKKISQKEIDKQAEKELKTVQQQCRILEETRKAYNEKAQFCLKHQKKNIDLLKQEYEELNLVVTLTKGQRYALQDHNNVKDLQELIQAQDCYNALIAHERSVMNKQDAQIKEMKEKITKQKLTISGTKGDEEIQRTQRRIKLLETHLHYITTKYNMTVKVNAKLRGEINDLRFQRTAFDSFYQKLMKELTNQKAIIDTVIEHSSVAHEQRCVLCPAQLRLQKHGFKADDLCPFEAFSAGDVVIPMDVGERAQEVLDDGDQSLIFFVEEPRNSSKDCRMLSLRCFHRASEEGSSSSLGWIRLMSWGVDNKNCSILLVLEWKLHENYAVGVILWQVIKAETEARIKAMKERRAKDIHLYNLEIKELIRIFDHEYKLKGFRQIKSFDRSQLEDEKMRLKREALTKEKALKAKQDSTDLYQATYDQLLELSGEEGLDVLMEQFLDNEEKNFANFSFMNELNNEIESLQDKIKAIEDEIVNLKSQQNQASEQRHLTIKELEAKIQKTTEDADSCEQAYKENNKILDQLISALEDLFYATSCDPTPIKQLLGESNGITSLNMMQYFSVIESKANELLQIQTYLLIKDLSDEESPPISLNPFLGGSELLSFVIPIQISSPIIAREDDTESPDDFDPKIMDFDGLQTMVCMDLTNRHQFTKTSSVHSHRGESKYLRDKKKALTA